MTKLNIPPVSLDSKSVLCLTVTIYQSSFEKFYVTKSYFRIFKLVLLVAAVGFVSTRFAQGKIILEILLNVSTLSIEQHQNFFKKLTSFSQIEEGCNVLLYETYNWKFSVKLFNWSYKDFGTNAFTDISLDQRQHYHDFPVR